MGPLPLRLDIFLKYSCLVPRRAAAKRLCDAGGVWINHREAKASSLVRINDTLDILIGSRKRTLRILEIPAGQASRKIAPELYLLIGESIIQNQDPLESPGPLHKGPGGC